MAPNKKKKKALSNPARGFATVSTPSKKVDESPPDPKDNPKVPLIDGKPVDAKTEGANHAGLDHKATNPQHMTPEELEQHLETQSYKPSSMCIGNALKKTLPDK